MNQLSLLVTINASTLVTILVVSVKLISFINRMEFKVELMWLDYNKRIAEISPHTHKRSDD